MSLPFKMPLYRRASGAFLIGFALLSAVVPASAHGLSVGRDADNKLVLMLEEPPPYHLGVSPFPEIPGYADAQPGFQSLLNDEPPVLGLPSTVEIDFSLLAADPLVRVWNDTGTAPMQIGEHFYLGVPFFMVHPVWQITPDAIVGETYLLTIRLHDRSGQLTDSDPIALPFVPVPEPASAFLLLAGLALVARRRVGVS